MYYDLKTNKFFSTVCKINVIQKHYEENYLCVYRAICVPRVLFLCTQSATCVYSAIYVQTVLFCAYNAIYVLIF